MGKFKVGDKVRVVRADGAVGDLWVSGDADKGIRLGDVGVVKEEGDYSYFVAFNGVSLLMNHEQLEPVKQTAATNAKFNVGDVVKYRDQNSARIMHNADGVRGKITSIKNGGYCFDGKDHVAIDMDLAHKRDGEFELELVSPTTPAIVAVIENGTPKPNARPRIHDTEAAATTEAERLAKLNPGQTFGVFVQTTARVADVTVRVA